jgi:hypothetical protein
MNYQQLDELKRAGKRVARVLGITRVDLDCRAFCY